MLNHLYILYRCQEDKWYSLYIPPCKSDLSNDFIPVYHIYRKITYPFVSIPDPFTYALSQLIRRITGHMLSLISIIVTAKTDLRSLYFFQYRSDTLKENTSQISPSVPDKSSWFFSHKNPLKSGIFFHTCFFFLLMNTSIAASSSIDAAVMAVPAISPGGLNSSSMT